MRVVQSVPECAELTKGKNVSVTVGNFDGVHLGHQTLISAAVRSAHAQNGHALVLTFAPHPALVLGKKNYIPLSTWPQRVELFTALGLDAVLCLPFDLALAQLSAQEFYAKILKPLGMTELFVGHDFKMGHDRAHGSQLQELGHEPVYTLPAVSVLFNHRRHVVSSSNIRTALTNGNIHLANAMLGRPYAVRGLVEHGAGRGGPLLGFPTANVCTQGLLIPEPGIYATNARVLPESQSLPAVTNIGHNPTFAGQDITLETHLLDFNADLYDRTLEVSFLDRLRGEQRFDGPDALKAQIQRDIDARRKLEQSV